MASEWRMVRVRVSTAEWLDQVRQRYERAAETGRKSLDVDQRNDRVSIDWVIRQLLIADENHQARARKQRAKRQQPGTSPGLAPQ